MEGREGRREGGEGGESNKYILTWETLDGASMHSNCNARLDLSRFLVLSFPPRRRCTRARVYTLPHDSCSLLFHDKSVGLCAARITPLSTSRQIL